MALISYDHAPRFVSFDPRLDGEEICQLLPHRTAVSMDRLRTPDNRGRRMHIWCAENCQGRYGRFWEGDQVVALFEYRDDAIMFKLIWA